MEQFYETKFADGHTVVVSAEDTDAFMEYMVRFYRSRMEAGSTKVTVKARTADGGLLDTETFKVSKEGFGAYARLVDMEQQ